MSVLVIVLVLGESSVAMGGYSSTFLAQGIVIYGLYGALVGAIIGGVVAGLYSLITRGKRYKPQPGSQPPS
ncbi:MAG TPA: hypothetical protein VFE91_00875 [Nitrososphaerales archaeon]|nr:hypothetical protein [Nitrososphaerales archaeon]